MPSFGSGEATAVARTTLSPLEVSAAPEACLAIRPVSNLICLPPASSIMTSCFMVRLFSSSFLSILELVWPRRANSARGDATGPRQAGLERQAAWGNGCLNGNDESHRFAAPCAPGLAICTCPPRTPSATPAAGQVAALRGEEMDCRSCAGLACVH